MKDNYTSALGPTATTSYLAEPKIHGGINSVPREVSIDIIKLTLIAAEAEKTLECNGDGLADTGDWNILLDHDLLVNNRLDWLDSITAKYVCQRVSDLISMAKNKDIRENI